MIEIKSSILIYRPVKQVFDFLCNPENDFQWQYGTLASACISEGDVAIGTTFRSVGHFIGHRVQSTYEVIEYDANNKYSFKSLSGPLQSFTTYTFNISKGCTQVIMEVHANAINMLDINENILEKKLKKQAKENMTMLKNILEVG